MHEADVAGAIELAVRTRVRGVYNVAGPQPVPLSLLVKRTGRRPFYLPEIAFRTAMGRFGLPKLPPGALTHVKHPVVVDDAAFRKATGYEHRIDEVEAMRQYRDAFPVVDR
jgi:UDP-glucose 4-epimerase